MTTLLIDYPAAGKLLSADGVMKPSTWESQNSREMPEGKDK
jgi:hypothetical protein